MADTYRPSRVRSNSAQPSAECKISPLGAAKDWMSSPSQFCRRADRRQPARSDCRYSTYSLGEAESIERWYLRGLTSENACSPFVYAPFLGRFHIGVYRFWRSGAVSVEVIAQLRGRRRHQHANVDVTLRLRSMLLIEKCFFKSRRIVWRKRWLIDQGRGLIENTMTNDINLRLLRRRRLAAYTAFTLVLGLGLGLGSVSNEG